MKYRGYTITRNPKPITNRDYDWDFVHDDYDGAPDSMDFRSGSAASIEQAKAMIDELEDE